MIYAIGILTVKQLPLENWLVNVMVPPNFCTAFLTMYKPSPLPFELRLAR